MKTIPKKLNDELNEDLFYKKCCLRWFFGCSGRVERHHNLIFGGRQVQAKFAILPACSLHHSLARSREGNDRFNWVMLNRASDEELETYSKVVNLKFERDRLNKIYGVWQQTN